MISLVTAWLLADTCAVETMELRTIHGVTDPLLEHRSGIL
jgi:hypothetical protein